MFRQKRKRIGSPQSVLNQGINNASSSNESNSGSVNNTQAPFKRGRVTGNRPSSSVMNTTPVSGKVGLKSVKSVASVSKNSGMNGTISKRNITNRLKTPVKSPVQYKSSSNSFKNLRDLKKREVSNPPFRTAAVGAARSQAKLVGKLTKSKDWRKILLNAIEKTTPMSKRVKPNMRGVIPGVGGTKKLTNVSNSKFLAAKKAASVKRKAKEARVAASVKKKANEVRVAASVKKKANEVRVAASVKKKANEEVKRKTINNFAGVLTNLARTPTKPVNSRRNSVTNIGNGGNSMNNVNSDSTIIKGTDKLTNKDAILLEIIKLSDQTKKMSNTNLRKLMNNKVSANSVKEYHTYTWALLYSMVILIDITKLQDVKMSRKFLKAIHRKLISKNVYTSGRSKNSMGNRESFVIPIKENDVVEFLFLIWLDGSHDGYIRESFSDFLDSEYCKEYFTNTQRKLAKNFIKTFPDPMKVRNVPKFPSKDGNRKSQMFKDFKLDTFKNVKGFNIIRNICIETESVWFFIHNFNPGTSKKIFHKEFANLIGKFEKVLKLDTEKILGIPQTLRKEIFRGNGLNNVSNGLKVVSIDYESNGSLISQIVRETDRFRPYITVGNLIDPGQKLLYTSAGAGDRRLLLSVMKEGESSIEDLNTLQCHYYVGPVDFSLVYNGLKFLDVKLSISQGGPSKQKGRRPTLNFFTIKINGKDIDKGTIKKNARTPQGMMGKFMGDALQYMIVAIQNKYRGKERYFASGDGVACFMYAYFCTKIGVQPKLIIDTGDQQVKTIGV